MSKNQSFLFLNCSLRYLASEENLTNTGKERKRESRTKEGREGMEGDKMERDKKGGVDEEERERRKGKKNLIFHLWSHSI